MIRSGRITASFYRRPAPTLRHPVAVGSVTCPKCDHTTHLLIFRARRRRTATSPHLVGYEVGEQQQQQDGDREQDGMARTRLESQ